MENTIKFQVTNHDREDRVFMKFENATDHFLGWIISSVRNLDANTIHIYTEKMLMLWVEDVIQVSNKVKYYNENIDLIRRTQERNDVIKHIEVYNQCKNRTNRIRAIRLARKYLNEYNILPESESVFLDMQTVISFFTTQETDEDTSSIKNFKTQIVSSGLAI